MNKPLRCDNASAALTDTIHRWRMNSMAKANRKLIDLTGQRFGRLIVIHRTTTTSYGGIRWCCKCDCGQTRFVFGHALRHGQTQSCGCWNREKATTHGMTNTPEFTVWEMMIQRCTNKNHTSYPDYGGRGIAICQRWLSSFQNFFDDMGQRPTPVHTLERTDNSRGYNPNNCRWATPLEQGANKRNNHHITFNDETLTLSQWARRCGISKSTILKRLQHGWSAERTLSEPSNRPKRSN